MACNNCLQSFARALYNSLTLSLSHAPALTHVSALARVLTLTIALASIPQANAGNADSLSLDTNTVLAQNAPELAATDATAMEITTIERKIQLTRNRFTQVAAELRDAKVLAAEKMLEYETARDQYQSDNNTVNANSMDHTQQRLALAEMAVESKTAKFERIQKKLKTLAARRQTLLAQQNQALPIQHNKSTAALVVPAPTPPETTSLLPTPAERLVQPRTQLAVQDVVPAAEPALTYLPLIKKALNATSQPKPVLTRQGKVTDAYLLNSELQKLEQHLITADTNSKATHHVKAYGTAIEGEITLTSLGANQYFARFIAPAGQVNLIVGVRREQYYRNELHLEFDKNEQGKEFVLIFDMNQFDQPRALVFQESLIFEQEMFAAHNEY